MSRLVFEDGDPGNLPAMINMKTGKLMAESEPEMIAARKAFTEQTTYNQRRAWHAVTCLNSRYPLDLIQFHEVRKLIEAAIQHVQP